MNCDCGSGLSYAECCEPYITGQKPAPTAEALMRARYTAHVKAAISFLKESTDSKARKHFDEKQVRDWAKNSEWLGLNIVTVQGGGESDDRGVVEFMARYRQKGKVFDHHEVAKFRKADGVWYFVDGDAHVHEEGVHDHHHDHHHHAPVTQVVRESPKIGRNDPCPCGSGKKYKKCHGAA